MTNCCSNCFADRHLQVHIMNESNRIGKCDFCRKIDVSIIDPFEVSGKFETVCSIYEKSSIGIPIVKLLNQDWLLFSGSEDIAENLFKKIFKDKNKYAGKFRPKKSGYPEGVIRWRQLKDELMIRNRYFLETEFQNFLLRLENWLPSLCMTIEKQPEHWYRARIEDGEKYRKKEMRAPPAKIATGGRANPAGIPYLYLGSDEKVVINEVRPHINNYVSIAEFQLSRYLRFVDLRKTRMELSPFSVNTPKDVLTLRDDIMLFEEINKELSRPVSKSQSGVEYVPSQYFCEFIKYNGFDGIVYESSFGDGFNVAVFNDDEEAFIVKNVNSVIVSKVNVEVKASRI